MKRDPDIHSEFGLRLSYYAVAALLTCQILLRAVPANAQVEGLFDTLNVSDQAGIGFAIRAGTSPYAGVDQVLDLIPIYVYEGEYAFLHSYKAGLKLGRYEHGDFSVYIAHRFEGFPYEQTPSSLAGMAQRNPGVDAGVTVTFEVASGNVIAEIRNDIAGLSNGSEFRIGFERLWRDGSLEWRPHFSLSYRNSELNDYYYGVRADEATANRPEYIPGDGYNFEAGLHLQYGLTRNWKLLTGVSVERLSSEIRRSPVVDQSWLVTGYFGAMYAFEDEPVLWTQRKPVLVRLFYGASTDCILNQLITLRCGSIDTVENSRITGAHFGRPFVERVNDWPLDFIGYAGGLYRDDGDFQQDSWQVDAYMKAVWYGFPWADALRTRLGFGIGLSYSSRVPFVEARDQAAKNQNTSKLLNYLDPSFDINVGDLLSSNRMKDTWIGVGVSHRPGAFASSELLGNVNGGSNYIYTHLETQF